jgi:predicted flap endonuclease-1-like 5' DNA nuclease
MSRKTAWLTVPVYLAVLALIVWWWWRESERQTEPAAGLMGGRPKPPGPPKLRTTAYPHPVSDLPAAEAPFKEPVGEVDAPVEKAAPESPTPPAEEAEVTAAKEDDLKVVEGIGPKIESVLKAAGIISFAQLADTEPDRLAEILADGGVRIGFPATWPEQAALAAAEDWPGLGLLQSQLKGGRRTA